MIKQCYKCGKIKNEEDFSFREKEKGIRRNVCKQCASIQKKISNKKYYENNKQKLLNNMHEYYKNNKKQISKQRKEYLKLNHDKVSLYRKKYYEINKGKYIPNLNTEKLKIRQERYRIKNREKINKRNSEYCKRVRPKINARRRNNYISNPDNRIKVLIRGAFKKFIGKQKIKITSEYLNGTYEEYRKHIENQFEPWMSWENQGYYVPGSWDDNNSATWKWQIDHIEPVSSFDFSDEVQVRKCWAKENLRPLSAKENLKKSNKK